MITIPYNNETLKKDITYLCFKKWDNISSSVMSSTSLFSELNDNISNRLKIEIQFEFGFDGLTNELIMDFERELILIFLLNL